MMRKFFILVFALILFSLSAAAQTKQRVRFIKGKSGAAVNGTVRGYDYRDYVVGASARQTISVKLSARGIYPVLTIFKPNGENLEGATETDEFTGNLPNSGDYVIRVGMMRAQARRKNSFSSYSLKIIIQ